MPSRNHFAVYNQSVLLGFKPSSTKGLTLNYFLCPQRKYSLSTMTTNLRCTLGKQSPFIATIIPNTQVHSVDKIKSGLVVQQVVYRRTVIQLKGVYWRKTCVCSLIHWKYVL